MEDKPNWKNIKLFHEIKPEEIIKPKEQKGEDFTILGSGSIVQQFANLGFIDEYQFGVVPVILGAGKSLFKNIEETTWQNISRLYFFAGRSFSFPRMQ
ncbi:MAG: dihydrofolate reductase family protein [Candidatus Methanoperedens sp.]|nr:dihydrofolate reductase family protein [Candidatus Methanoperedens sp.]